VFWWLLFILAIAVGLSLWLRIVYFRHNQNGAANRASPLSLAIQELVGTAGGIYLSVITLTSFLKLDVPEKVALAQVNLDPVALGAIIVAIIQPAVLRLLSKLLK
jgi:hypothetical protein